MLAKRTKQNIKKHNKTLKNIRKNIKINIDKLKNIRKKRNKKINKYKNNSLQFDIIIKELTKIKNNIRKFEITLNTIKNQLDYLLCSIPNVLHESVHYGTSEIDNYEVKKYGVISYKISRYKSHENIKAIKSLLDIDTAVSISKSRFMVLYDRLAYLHRALIQFMMDEHKKNNYKEVYVPSLVNSKSLYGTSQLPKFYHDLFKVEGQDLWLIPTSEVPVTNIIANKTIDTNSLPIKFVCHSSCFRSEAGSYGKDTKGIFRQHQFEKVELVQFVSPENSYKALKSITEDARLILDKLEIPHRIVNLCSGDIGFSSAKTYDIEVWMPSQDKYREISSCSNFESFQSNRMNIKYRDQNNKDKAEYLHSLNASALSIGRTLIAIVENYQNEDGTVKIPKILQSYMKNIKYIDFC